MDFMKSKDTMDYKGDKQGPQSTMPAAIGPA